jgi:hypothetical protein
MCDVSGCERAVYSRGLREPHYRRRLRTGSVSGEVPVGARPSARACMADGCDRGATERGLCHGHYLRLIRCGDIRAEEPLLRQVDDECEVDGCGRKARLRRMCRTHANRKRKYGDVQADKPIREIAGAGFDSHGYWHVPVPAELRHLTNGRSPYPEHRLVMAQLLGRALTPDESVHHVNGNRRDNTTDGPLRQFRSGNLELWSRWQPSGQRVADKIAFAVEILERYLPEALAAQRPLIFE